MEFFMANREGIIKIDRNVETVNCKGRRPHQWMEFTQAMPRNHGSHNTGAVQAPSKTRSFSYRAKRHQELFR